MKKLNVLIIASLTGLALAGGALFGDSASAKSADHSKDQQQVEQPAPQKGQRQLKDWEKKYYELHPEEQKKDEEKANPEKHRHHSEDDDIEWHRI